MASDNIPSIIKISFINFFFFPFLLVGQSVPNLVVLMSSLSPLFQIQEPSRPAAESAHGAFVIVISCNISMKKSTSTLIEAFFAPPEFVQASRRDPCFPRGP